MNILYILSIVCVNTLSPTGVIYPNKYIPSYTSEWAPNMYKYLHYLIIVNIPICYLLLMGVYITRVYGKRLLYITGQ